MSLSPTDVVLPRPGQKSVEVKPPIPGPTESAFTDTFGSLLPPAKYLQTENGKAAYYEILPSTPATSLTTLDRVLLIHGVQTPALGLLPLVRALQKAFPQTHFVLFDHWGHGLSDTPFLPHEPSLFHGLIDALLDQLNWPTVHIIGYSFGGTLTPAYVVSHSTKVKSFTLVAPAGLMRLSYLSAEEQGHMRGGGDEDAARKWVHSWLEGGGELIVPGNWEESVSKGEIVAPAIKRWQLQKHAGHSASVVGILRDGGVFDNHDAFAEVARTGIPSLAVLGELDGIVDAQTLGDVGITNVEVVSGAGHGVVRGNVPEVAAAITAFWNKIGPNGN
ncbi:alpha/beta-hydrolase [Karstenula rhodostoma CBS 690.94]|uniref:Alpha/beta-hydrolase n=1 Tax=Karstenula rhodostoma CBS 690.94 TaxID=1392251 RepID=A0A9P4U5G3_9PLEO|nr:alpha/beta-hydrolase [Karstenula rhodostoma CBS 690.94]